MIVIALMRHLNKAVRLPLILVAKVPLWFRLAWVSESARLPPHHWQLVPLSLTHGIGPIGMTKTVWTLMHKPLQATRTARDCRVLRALTSFGLGLSVLRTGRFLSWIELAFSDPCHCIHIIFCNIWLLRAIVQPTLHWLYESWRNCHGNTGNRLQRSLVLYSRLLPHPSIFNW